MENKTVLVSFLTNVTIGGSAACCTCLFTNPLDVVKIRMQVQGELKARGHHTTHYRNPLQALFVVIRKDGLLALQKGIVPALHYQFFMNGFRLGSYQMAVTSGMTKDDTGKVRLHRSVICGALAGCIGAVAGSPFYLVKVQLQTQAHKEIAVGHQHSHESMRHAFRSMVKNQGLRSLLRGVNAAIPAVTIGSATQLSSFSVAKDFFTRNEMNTFETTSERDSNCFSDPIRVFYPDSMSLTVASTIISGVCLSLVFTPFDVVSTRLYNQGVNAKGKGLLYSGFFNCFHKIYKTEGILGFYKGISPSFLRLVPHTVLCLSFWDRFSLWFKSK